MIMSTEASIEVSVRVRPINERESNSQTITKVLDNTVSLRDSNGKDKSFQYDYLYDIDTKQQTIYENIGKKVIESAHTGYNSCVFAYGQTGCFAIGTPIMMYNGKYKSVESIIVGDILMGDDSTPRKVKKLFQGQQMMYDIVDKDTNITQYTVNEDHIMVFRKFDSRLERTYIDFIHKVSDVSRFNLLQDAAIEMSIKDWLNLHENEKALLACYTTTIKFTKQPIIDISVVETLLKDFDCPNANLDILREKLSNVINEYLHINNEDQLKLLTKILHTNIKLTTEQFAKLAYIARCNGYTINRQNTSQNTSQNIHNTHNAPCLKYTKSHFRPLITPTKVDTYYGFELNGNHRFIGAGFNVLRNSGKTYSMMGGSKTDAGLIPRICITLFKDRKPNITYRVEMSYFEIYCERVKDLLCPGNQDKIKVRDHKDYGPYVEGLTQHAVDDVKSIVGFITLGNKERATASTMMNNHSSRSHAIIMLYFTQIITESLPEQERSITREIVSKINLVDLAGSERVSDSKVEGINLEEAKNINKSLTTLSRVIQQLVKKQKEPNTHISFRDSVLTRILQESLGGNSRTFMLATISPAEINYNETLSTLRYASNAKHIVNSISINENSNDRIIRILRKEIEELRNKLKSGIGGDSAMNEIAQRELFIKEKQRSWEERESESRRQLDIYYKRELELKNNEIEQANKNLDLIKQEADARLKEHELKHKREKSEFEKNRIVEAIKESHEFVEQRVENKVREIQQKCDDIQNKYEELQKKYIAIEYLYNDKVEECRRLNDEVKKMQDLHSQQLNGLKSQLKQLMTDKNILTRQVQQLQSKLALDGT